MNRKNRIESKLQAALNPIDLQIFDESHKHAGHEGMQPEGESHYRLFIISPAFKALSRVARQRKIYALLQEEFETGLHALSIQAYSPDEKSD